MGKIPLYEKIMQHYKVKIITGEFLPGKQLPTENAIAQEFHVSRITVVRALKELEIGRFIHRIKGSGSYVNNGDWKTKNAPSNQSIISLVVPFADNFSPDIFKGIEEVAKKHGYFVTFHNSSDDLITEKNIVNEIIARGSHGIILYPTVPPYNMELFSKLSINKYPFVLIDRKIPGLDLSLIWANNQKGFYDITAHLLELGHKRIIFVGSSVYSLSSEFERYQGFCKAHIEHEVPLLNKHLYWEADIKTIPSDYKPKEEFLKRVCNYLLDTLEKIDQSERPTAIAAVNDQIAGAIISTALERGISIPQKYSVTGFDNLPFAPHLPAPLTTVAQPAYEIGKEAAKELFKHIKSPARKPTVHTVDVSVIIRKSTTSFKE
jgi:DNA-binding LacI/PurR family transcriptional regulator